MCTCSDSLEDVLRLKVMNYLKTSLNGSQQTYFSLESDNKLYYIVKQEMAIIKSLHFKSLPNLVVCVCVCGGWVGGGEGIDLEGTKGYV